MRLFIRILVAGISLAEVIAWTFFTNAVWRWGKTGAGAGDGSGADVGAAGAAVFGFLLIGAIWFVPVSPYICMVLGSFNLITGKVRRFAYPYALMILLLMTMRSDSFILTPNAPLGLSQVFLTLWLSFLDQSCISFAASHFYRRCCS